MRFGGKNESAARETDGPRGRIRRFRVQAAAAAIAVSSSCLPPVSAAHPVVGWRRL